uniref:Nucleolar protein 14 homolog n=2 Tax=Cacopsylla melanoneura TaxID=428564 RepID=A0A8D9BT31_9HEMI
MTTTLEDEVEVVMIHIMEALDGALPEVVGGITRPEVETPTIIKEEEEEEDGEELTSRNSTTKTTDKKKEKKKSLLGLETEDLVTRDDHDESDETNRADESKIKKVKFSKTENSKTTVDKGVDSQLGREDDRTDDTEQNSPPKVGGILKVAENVNKSVEFGRIRTENDEQRIQMDTDLKRMGTDLPFTFDIPTEYDDLVELFDGRNENEMRIILERMIKVNHWSLGGDNKSRLNQLFAFLLQYLDDSVDPDQPKRCWQILNSLSPVLFTLCLMDPDSSGDYLRGVIQEKYQSYAKRETRAPTVHSLLFLKLVSTLFPTSDARHYVTTPALVFLCHALARVCPVTERDMSVTLFLATLAVEYIDLSKRYLPELVNYVQGCLLLFSRHPPLPLHKPFKSSSAQMFCLDARALTQQLALNGDSFASTTSSSEEISKENPSATNFPTKTKLSPSKTCTSIDENSHVLQPTMLCLTARDMFSTSGKGSGVKSGQCSSLFNVKAILCVLKLVNVLVDKYVDQYEASYLIFMRMRVALNQLSEEMNNCLHGKQADGGERYTMDAGNKVEEELMKGSGQKTELKKAVGKHNKTDAKKLVERMEEPPVLSAEARRLLSHVHDTLTQTVTKLDTARADSTFPYVAREKEKPKILRLFEPEIKPVLKFHTKGNQREREKLMAKYKKEMKGAIREIRKDGRFMQKVKLRETNRADEERKRKVKEILGGCANQEGEIRGLKRKKK